MRLREGFGERSEPTQPMTKPREPRCPARFQPTGTNLSRPDGQPPTRYGIAICPGCPHHRLPISIEPGQDPFEHCPRRSSQ